MTQVGNLELTGLFLSVFFFFLSVQLRTQSSMEFKHILFSLSDGQLQLHI